MEFLVYIANGLFLVTYLVKDIFRLRLLSLLAASCLVTYFYMLPEPLLVVIRWNLVFIAMNVLQLIRLLADRYRGNQAQETSRSSDSSPRRNRTASLLKIIQDVLLDV